MRKVRKWLWLDVLALLVVISGVVGAALLLSAGDRGEKPTPFPTAAMTAEPTPTATPTGRPTATDWGDWPTYGYDNARTRYAPNVKLRPPFKLRWRFDAHDLLEFPPSIDEGRLYINAGHGYVYCLDARNGKRLWRYAAHGKFASTPAVDKDEVYVTTFAGRMICLDKVTGHRKWAFRDSGPSESSPLVWRGRIFFGDRNGMIWALSAKHRKVVWRYRCDGRINGAPAQLGDRIVVGTYGGTVYCLSYDGRLYWKRSTSGAVGVTDPFYATAALAYNTVYIGSTGRHVFAFDLSNGGTRWKATVGAWVYSSAAVWRGLVLLGCYDTYFYAFNAASGRVAWRFNAGAKISGSATVLNGVVYFATIKRHHTWALDARSGRKLWDWPDGAYTPVTADRKQIYLCGVHKLYCLVPKK